MLLVFRGPDEKKSHTDHIKHPNPDGWAVQEVSATMQQAINLVNWHRYCQVAPGISISLSCLDQDF